MIFPKAVLGRAVAAVCALGFGALFPSAFAQRVDVRFDQQTDFSRVHRYQWRTHPVFEKNPELREIYSTGIQLVLEAGNAELMRRGLQPDDSSPDVFITFFLLTKDVQHIKTITESGWGPGYEWYGAPTWTTTEIENYVRGMLVIDIVDARTSKLLWRAMCGDDVKDMRKRDKNINAAVKKAFERFPPK